MKSMSGYILNIEPNQVVDRDDYIDLIKPIIEKPTHSNIIILKAQSAVGKSAMVDKLLYASSFSQEIIRIRTLPINNSEKVEEWEYLNNLFNAIYKKYNQGHDSFQSYIYALKNKTNNKIILKYIFDVLYEKEIKKKKSLLNVLLYVGFLRLFKLGTFDINNLIDDNSIKGNRIKLHYIKYIFQKYRVIISIDNIQNVDQHSLREIENLMNECKDNLPQFVFEYTITDVTTSERCDVLAEYFSATGIPTQVINLEPIKKEYIVDVISKHIVNSTTNWGFNISIQERYEENNNGNIREMIDYGIYINRENKPISISDNQYSLDNILSLTEQAKQLLSIIICANNSIDKVLLDLIGSKIELDIKNAIEELIDMLVVEIKGNNYVLSHASLADVWFAYPNEFNKYDNVAYACLEKEYLNIINDITQRSNIVYDQAWLNMIQIYSKTKTEKIVSLFEYIDVDYKNLISNENAWKYIQNIIEVTKYDIYRHYNLYKNIIRYCFESELYSQGYNVVEQVMRVISDDILILYKAMYLSALDEHEKNVKYCENAIKAYSTNSVQYFNLKLISLSSYRSLHKIDKCFKIHKEFINNKFLMNTQEWGYFLRLSEMYLDRNISLKLLKKSVKFFESKEDYIQAGKSLISYSFVLATQGKLKLAKNKIQKAEAYLSEKRMGRHMFLVNNAAIRLLNGDYSEEVWEILNEAEITTVVPFDKLAIITNKLVWCIENKHTHRYDLLIKQALELLNAEPDRHIHGLIYYNIYYLLKERNENGYEIFLKKANQMKSYCKPVKARLEKKPTPETKFALKKPWHVCFLAYWTYDLL